MLNIHGFKIINLCFHKVVKNFIKFGKNIYLDNNIIVYKDKIEININFSICF